MEVLVIRADWRDDMEAWALTHFGVHRLPVRPSLLKLWVEIISVVLVAGGVFGELAIGVVITSINGTLRSQEATLQDDSGQLVALIDQEAAGANERASQADKKRLELENRIVDIFGTRQLTPGQSTDIVKKLSGLKGVKVDVFVFAIGNPYSATEVRNSKDFGRAVVHVLGDGAHMDAEGWLLDSCHGSGASNLVVAVTGNNGDDQKIAYRLIKAFPSSIGIDPVPEVYPPYCEKFSDLDKSRPNKRKHDAAISITIGSKISPLLTREMLEPVDEQGKP